MATKLLRGRRVFRLILFLGAAGLIFVIFQIFSVEILYGMSSKDEHRSILVAKQQFNFDGYDSKVFPNLQQDPECLDGDGQKCLKVKNSSNAVIQAKNKLYLNNGLGKIDQNELFGSRLGGSHVKPDHFKLDDNVVKPDSDSYENLDELNQDYDFRNDEVNQEVGLEDLVVDESKLPLGVPKTMANLYLPDGDNKFTCFETKEQIDWSQVNDDYCDCGDSTDEPGTNACPESQFYCKFQLPGSFNLKLISGSKVNDGICDCCDGSDEWQNVKLLERLLLHDDQVHYGIKQGPCVNSCSKLQAEVQQQSVIHQQGAKIKQQYLANLNVQVALKSNKLYGKDGAYYMLAEECFTRSADKYQYTVCPFKNVKQSDGTKDKVIGRNGTWMDARRLKMGGGDSEQCPGLRRRESIIEFECSVQNQILSVQETEVCEYTFRFSTPAAC